MNELEVTVAVTHPFDVVFDVPSAAPYGAAYADLPKVTITAHGAQTLREVLALAADELSIRPARLHVETMTRLAEADRAPLADQHVSDLLVYVGFRRPDDDEIEWRGSGPGDVVRRRTQRLQTTTLVVRDDSGAAVWRKPGLEATYDELVDAAQAGLIDGDPLQPYLIPSIPQGDLATLGEWKHFVDALKVIWDATNGLAAAGGAWGFIELVRRAQTRRSKRAIAAVERHAPAWSDRGAAPADLFRLLIAKPRTTGEVAALLGCSDSEANAILWAFGFSYDDDDRSWTYRGDPTAQLLGDDIDLVFADVFNWPTWEHRLQEFTTTRLRQLGSTGMPPSLEEGRERVGALADRHVEAPLGVRLLDRVRHRLRRRRSRRV